jgi:hypothetical protein
VPGTRPEVCKKALGQRMIMTKKPLLALVVVAAMGGLASVASAANLYTFTFDELGNNSFTYQANPPISLPWGVAPDPFNPGVSTLYYDLSAFGARVVAGDIWLWETTPSTFSDLLRFEPNPNVNSSYLFVYSDNSDGATSLADVGPPPNFQSNLGSTGESGPENGLNGLFGWTPLASDGGYLSIGSVTYNFISDVPEPSTLSLIGVSLAGWALVAYRRRGK